MVTTKTPRVTGLFEAHLPVADVQRAIRFYRGVVGLDVAYEVPDRGAAFLWIGEPGGAMLGLWSLGTAPMSMRLHDHMLEYLAMLDEPARPDAGITTWSDWVR